MEYNNRKENNMFANYWEIQNRVKYIEEELSRIEAVEKGMPEGELIVAKNDKNYKWYFHNQNTTIYLPKKEIELAKKLTLKKYYQLRKGELQRELQACQINSSLRTLFCIRILRPGTLKRDKYIIGNILD